MCTVTEIGLIPKHSRNELILSICKSLNNTSIVTYVSLIQVFQNLWTPLEDTKTSLCIEIAIIHKISKQLRNDRRLNLPRKRNSN